jgi:hypothetical protein
VAVQGVNGHAILGLNDPGFFGIGVPRPGAAVDLLLASRGILTLTPVLAAAVAGAFLMRRGEHRAEANVILAVTGVFFLYNCGYWLPFGGGTPGPRFLIPTLPFLALGLAVAYRRLPALTLALAIPSITFMVVASLTFPLLGDNGTGNWANELVQGVLEHTVLTALGVEHGWLAALPVLAALAAAIVLAVRATPRAPLGDIRPAIGVVAAWAALSAIGPTLAGDVNTPLDGSAPALAIVAASAILAVGCLLVLRLRERRDDSPGGLAVASQPG